MWLHVSAHLTCSQDFDLHTIWVKRFAKKWYKSLWTILSPWSAYYLSSKMWNPLLCKFINFPSISPMCIDVHWREATCTDGRATCIDGKQRAPTGSNLHQHALTARVTRVTKNATKWRSWKTWIFTTCVLECIIWIVPYISHFVHSVLRILSFRWGCTTY
jgi:hypothetical protein